jgi:hypothetical protein
MGRGVLKVAASGAGGLVRVYSAIDHTTGSVTAVVINLGANATTVPITLSGAQLPAQSTPDVARCV